VRTRQAAALAPARPKCPLRQTARRLLAGFLLAVFSLSSTAQTALKVYMGGQQRPDIMRELFAQYTAAHPGVKVSLEIGGATSDLHQKYLNMVLTAGDNSLDVFLIDVIRPAQFAAAGWAEPLNSYLGTDFEPVMSRYLPAYRAASTVNRQVVALPALADALFLYYRKDLLAKYGIEPPTTWAELAAAARTIQQGERNPELQGLSFQAKSIEGTVCTFLLPYWSQGGELLGDGRMLLDRPKAEAGLRMWQDMVRQGVAKANVAEVGTDDTRKEFQAGKVVFAVNWGYAWNHFASGAGSVVKGRVGVVKLPAMPNGKSVSCMGGWSWAVSAFSRHKTEAVALVRWLSSPEVSRQLAIKASFHPVFASVYKDREVLAAVPWFADALSVVESARPRPVTPMYRAVSDALRINTNTVMAGVKTPTDALAEIEQRLFRAMR
jgi:multiple sugar transport system substrate-binding protein